MDYIYLGDRITDDKYKNKQCKAVVRNGKCITRKSKMLVMFDGKRVNILRNRLRKV